MVWLSYVSFFFGGIFLGNTVPHLVSGVMGRPFQTPFAKPSGIGLSSSMVNVLWGGFNLAVSYVLILRVGAFDIRNTCDILAVGIGALVISLFAAHHFGQFHGGRSASDLAKK